ncbi:MAG: hypothetical protein IPL83_02890 [Bdellovibrionales bacterium]|nr:hypothetical protein [Bdellovibrionales bacterium]
MALFAKLSMRIILALLPVLCLGSCGSSDDGGSDDSNIVSEIDEATEDISSDEGGSSDGQALSDESGEDSEVSEDGNEEFASDYEEQDENGDQGKRQAASEEGKGDEEFGDEEFADEDLAEGEGDADKTDETEEVAGAGDEDFEDFEDAGDTEGQKGGAAEEDQELAQNDEPTLESLDSPSTAELNEPAEKDGDEDIPTTPEPSVDNPKDLNAAADIPSEETAEGSSPAESAGPSGRGWVPVKKIRSEPFRQNGRLMNSVYIVRNDSNLAGVSQKLFGKNRAKIFLEDNPHLARGLKTGDKVYYNSPLRPDDSTTMKVSYDDVGAVAEEYVTRVGDNIRNFSKKLLGFPDAWKEVWSTNENVDSKDVVDQGLTLRYWRDDLGSLNTKLAKESQPPSLDVADGSVADDFNSGLGQTEAIPPPPGPDTNGMANNAPSPNMNPAMPPPEVPQVAENIPPPLPPPQPLAAAENPPEQAGNGANGDSEGGGSIGKIGVGDNTTLIYITLGLIAAMAIFIKRKKGSRPSDLFEATQV